ncbi:MAG: hypothetical protein Q7S87_08610 [Agitococcus sp.]|nr:hypothetical protein [Agitococcus sp.]MDO9177631.1 hypothetical protein [Agitococcus sp.]
MLKIEIDAIARTTNVFVNIGLLTVKQGRVVAHRLTIGLTEKPQIEYLVHWFGQGDRKTPEEWFPPRDVHLAADAAFNLLTGAT